MGGGKFFGCQRIWRHDYPADQAAGAAGGSRPEDIENQPKNDNLAGRLASSTAGAPVLTAVQALKSGLLKVDVPVAPV